MDRAVTYQQLTDWHQAEVNRQKSDFERKLRTLREHCRHTQLTRSMLGASGEVRLCKTCGQEFPEKKEPR